MACRQGTLTFRTSHSVPLFWDLLILQLLRLVFPNLPCLFSILLISSSEYSMFFIVGCSGRVETVALMASTWNLPVLTPVGSDKVFGEKAVFNTLTRLAYDQNKLGKFFLNVLNHFSWQNIYIYYDTRYFLFESVGKGLYEALRDAGLTSYLRAFTSGSSSYDVAALLKDGSSVSRGIEILVCSVWFEKQMYFLGIVSRSCA